MILLIHILIASISIALTGAAYAWPARSRLALALGFVAGTIASGTVLVILAPTHLASACLSGLVYLAIVLSGIVAANHKLARAAAKV